MIGPWSDKDVNLCTQCTTHWSNDSANCSEMPPHLKKKLRWKSISRDKVWTVSIDIEVPCFLKIQFDFLFSELYSDLPSPPAFLLTQEYPTLVGRPSGYTTEPKGQHLRVCHTQVILIFSAGWRAGGFGWPPVVVSEAPLDLRSSQNKFGNCINSTRT